MGFVRADADRPDLVLGNVTATTEQRQEPAWIGVLAATDVHAKPERILEAGAVTFLLRGAAGFGCVLDQVFGLGKGSAVGADLGGGNILRRALVHQALGKGAVFLIIFYLLKQRIEQA